MHDEHCDCSTSAEGLLACRLQWRRRDGSNSRVVVLEKEEQVGRHQSGTIAASFTPGHTTNRAQSRRARVSRVRQRWLNSVELTKFPIKSAAR